MTSRVTDDRMGAITASRTIDAVYPDGRTSTLSIQLGTPRFDTGMDAWACPCRIEGLDDSKVRNMFGVDSLQAVVIATDVLRRFLAAATEEHGLTFAWDGTEALSMSDVLW